MERARGTPRGSDVWRGSGRGGDLPPPPPRRPRRDARYVMIKILIPSLSSNPIVMLYYPCSAVMPVLSLIRCAGIKNTYTNLPPYNHSFIFSDNCLSLMY